MANLDLGNVRGPEGIQGVGIKSVTFNRTDEEGNNIYDIVLTDESKHEITAPRGPIGVTGNTGATGEQGPIGIGIKNITFKETDSNGNNIYTINLTDGGAYDITVPRGEKGEQGDPVEIDFSDYYTKTQVNTELAKKLGVDDKAKTAAVADSAAKLSTARTIGGVSFDGTGNIDLPGVNKAGNQNTTGNAGTATKLQTARTINGVSFDGTANITVADSTKIPLSGNSTKSGNLAVTGTLTSGEFTSSGNVTAYSDVRLKRDVEDIPNVLKKIMNVRVVSFKMLGQEQERYGVIAQELKEIFPELVQKDTNGMYKVNYITLNLLLIKAFQEYVRGDVNVTRNR